MMILYRTSIIPASLSRTSLMNLGKYYLGRQCTSYSHDFFHKVHTHLVDKRSVQIRKLVCVPCTHYRDMVKCSYPTLISSFIRMFRLFMNFRHLGDYFVFSLPALYVI